MNDRSFGRNNGRFRGQNGRPRARSGFVPRPFLIQIGERVKNAMRFQVSARADHIAKVTAVRKPVLAIAELVWNGFDADASRVDVTLVPSALGGIEAIEVVDDGWGMSRDHAQKSFSGLGGSWKKDHHQNSARRSPPTGPARPTWPA